MKVKFFSAVLCVVFLFSAGGAAGSVPAPNQPYDQSSMEPGDFKDYMEKIYSDMQKYSYSPIPSFPWNYGLPQSCPNCGKQFKDDAHFCTACGTAVAIICPKCEAAVELGAKFCSNCGVSLQKTCACGAILEEGVKFCPSCGKPVK